MDIDTIRGWFSTSEEMGVSEFERLVRGLANKIVKNDERIRKISLIRSEESGGIKPYRSVLMQFSGSQRLTYEFFSQLEKYLEDCIEKSGVKGRINHPRDMALYVVTSPSFKHLQRWDLLALEKYDRGAAYFQIPGTPTEQALSKLSNLGDELIMLKPNDGKGGRMWFAYNEKGQYIAIAYNPGVLLARYFDGDFTHHDEKEVARTFEQIKNIALDEKLLRNFMESKEGENLRDRAERGWVDIDYELRRCTFYEPGWNTPRIWITQFVKGKDRNLKLSIAPTSEGRVFTLDELPERRYQNVV